MKKKKLLTIILILIVILFLGITTSEAALELNELKFDAQINDDGSMDITETWDIYISSTNTLFKTFKKDNTKYSGITNVQVKDITEGKQFTNINREMYHVTKNCYYGLTNSKGLFEIAWGVGLDNSSATKRYQISYTVQDAIAKYNDYAELYWQFVGNDFEIDADKITGTIILPRNANSMEDIKVWGHTNDLNGTIYATDLNKIEFKINNYSSGNYVEIRTLIPNNLIETSARTYNTNIYNKVIEEETKWANEANARREKEKMIMYVLIGIGTLVTIGFVIVIIVNIKKLRKLEKKFKTQKIEYFRELPYEDATPAEAIFVMSKGMNKAFSQSFSANILDLCLKKYITLGAEKTGTVIKSEIVKITILDKNISELKEDQKQVLEFLKEIAGVEKQLTTKDITTYLKKHTSKVQKLDSKLEKILEKEEQDNGNYNKKNFEKYNNNMVATIMSIIFGGFILFIFAPLGIALIINGIITGMITGKINVFTQKGIDEQEKWKAFKKYMEDFSLLKEKEIPELVLWEKYLVFATAFGISEKVLKQLKVIYPEFNDINSTMYTYSYIHIMNSVDIGKCINTSVYSAIGSSGSGSGGGFSGGGGGGRWPVAAEADAKKL